MLFQVTAYVLSLGLLLLVLSSQTFTLYCERVSPLAAVGLNFTRDELARADMVRQGRGDASDSEMGVHDLRKSSYSGRSPVQLSADR